MILAAAIMLAAVALSSPVFADTLILQGSTTFNRRVMEPHQAAIEQASGHELTVIPNKTTPGLIALLEGRAHMAMISAPLQGEIEVLQKILPGWSYDRLRSFDILSTRIALAVHRTNPIHQAPLSTIKRVLLGEITNWKELGGADQPIRIVLAGGGGAMTVVESVLLEGQPLKIPGVIYVKTPVQLVQVVEQEPGALGFAQLSLARQRGIQEIATDRPLETTLSLVTLGDPTPAMQAVIGAMRRIVQKAM